MTTSTLDTAAEVETADRGWKSLYAAAGVTALLAVLPIVLDVFLSFGTENIQYGAQTAVEWFARFQSDTFRGLRDLGILNIINMALMVPVFLALYAAHRSVNPVYAALAAILYLVGTAI
jgi:hypothetical protein